jgi:hypothetical protein
LVLLQYIILQEKEKITPFLKSATLLTCARLAGPVVADMGKQVMFNGVPFGCPRGIVADGHCQSVGITELVLQVVFPCTRPGAVAPATVG